MFPVNVSISRITPLGCDRCGMEYINKLFHRVTTRTASPTQTVLCVAHTFEGIFYQNLTIDVYLSLSLHQKVEESYFCIPDEKFALCIIIKFSQGFPSAEYLKRTPHLKCHEKGDKKRVFP